jgi:hypothetical protein
VQDRRVFLIRRDDLKCRGRAGHELVIIQRVCHARSVVRPADEEEDVPQIRQLGADARHT